MRALIRVVAHLNMAHLRNVDPKRENVVAAGWLSTQAAASPSDASITSSVLLRLEVDAAMCCATVMAASQVLDPILD